MLLPFFGLRRGNSGKPVRHQMTPFQVEMWMWSVRQRWSCIKIPRKGPTVTYYFFSPRFWFRWWYIDQPDFSWPCDYFSILILGLLGVGVSKRVWLGNCTWGYAFVNPRGHGAVMSTRTLAVYVHASKRVTQCQDACGMYVCMYRFVLY